MNDVRGRAQRLMGTPVRLADLALAFDESRAATAEVHVDGRGFFPPMLADIGAAASSVHINQFGFRPGTIGEAFATALLAKAAEGVHVRLVVDGQGSRPDGSGRELYGRLLAGGVDVRVVRATRLRARSQPAAAGGPRRWGVSQLGHIDHRKLVVVDGRIGWVGGAGIEDHFDDGRFHDLFVRLTGPVISQLQLVFLATFRWLGGAIAAGRSSTRCSLPPRTCPAWSRRPCCTTRRGATGRSRPPSPRRSTAPARRSTWSTPTSPTGG